MSSDVHVKVKMREVDVWRIVFDFSKRIYHNDSVSLSKGFM